MKDSETHDKAPRPEECHPKVRAVLEAVAKWHDAHIKSQDMGLVANVLDDAVTAYCAACAPSREERVREWLADALHCNAPCVAGSQRSHWTAFSRNLLAGPLKPVRQADLATALEHGYIGSTSITFAKAGELLDRFLIVPYPDLKSKP